MPKCIENAKIACLDFNLHKARLKMGINVRLARANCPHYPHLPSPHSPLTPSYVICSRCSSTTPRS